MPFTISWIEEKISSAAQAKRLAHAFLLTGRDLEELEAVFHRLASLLLKSDNPNHPDLHIIRPESKSRRILVEQVRELEHSLQLKAYQADCKVAAIFSADRMCLGSAETANAFLKTLEEPPDNTTIFLITEQPSLLLPTIRSRCILLPIKSDKPTVPDEDLAIALRNWAACRGHPADIAYKRASIISDFWQDLRIRLEENFKTLIKEADDDQEKVLLAQIESQFVLERDVLIASLIEQTWKEALSGNLDLLDAERTCESFEELRMSLARNMEQALALERCTLKIAGVI